MTYEKSVPIIRSFLLVLMGVFFGVSIIHFGTFGFSFGKFDLELLGSDILSVIAVIAYTIEDRKIKREAMEENV